MWGTYTGRKSQLWMPSGRVDGMLHQQCWSLVQEIVNSPSKLPPSDTTKMRCGVPKTMLKATPHVGPGDMSGFYSNSRAPCIGLHTSHFEKLRY